MVPNTDHTARSEVGRDDRVVGRGRWLGICLALLVPVLSTAFDPAAAQEKPHHRLNEQEKRGKLIYLKGTTVSGREVTALLGEEQIEVPASTLPCASCHGYDGIGRPEGGVEPPNITWESLTKSYGHNHANGRNHPAFSEQSLRKAIISGIDSGGNKLRVTMPVYRMEPDDMSDLLAYLKLLGTDADPGVTESAIRIGMILPAAQPEIARISVDLLNAYFNELNDQGGIYNRKIELVTEMGTDTTAGVMSQAVKLIEKDQVFALVGGFIAGNEKKIDELIRSEEVPLIGPVTLFPQIDFPLNRQIFYLYPGLQQQVQVFPKFVSEKLGLADPAMAVVYPESSLMAGQGKAVVTMYEKIGNGKVIDVPYPVSGKDFSSVVMRLKSEKPTAVAFLGSGAEAVALMKSLAGGEVIPYFFMPGSLAASEVLDAPSDFRDRFFLSYPTLPSDQTPGGVAELTGLIERNKLAKKHMLVQLSIFCSARTLVEGLKLAGRDLVRERLIMALEGLYEFQTGLSPKLTFGPNRRIGALGAYIIAVDLEKKQFKPSSEWISVN